MTRDRQPSQPIIDHRDFPGEPLPWEVEKVLVEVARVDLRVDAFESRLLKLEKNNSMAPFSYRLPNGGLVRASIWGLLLGAVAAVAIAALKYL